MFYTHSCLDRADHLRKQESELKSIRTRDTALLVPVLQGKSLTGMFNDSEIMRALTIRSQLLPDHDTVFLGRTATHHFFAVDVSELDDDTLLHIQQNARTIDGQPSPGEFRDLRSTGPLLSGDEGALLAYARGLVYWNAITRFCYRCGSALAHHYHGHSRQCANANCGYTLFPRVDPAVIMLVTYQPQDDSPALCLLGRSPGWPDGVFSTLAGFVEAGESLEMAVQREVYEEASIQTDDIRYVASQPWPFPRSIMLGFEATAISTDIVCDPDELDDAQWFTREQIQSFGRWGDDTEGYKLPRKDSIAGYLINRWVNNEK